MDRNTLLLAIDQFESGQAAVDFTIGFAGRHGSEVKVLHVRERPRSLRVPPVESLADATVLVADAVRRIQLSGLQASGRVRSGQENAVGHLIVDEAACHSCNAIVLGSFRLRGVRRIAGHGVRDCVMRHTMLPVFITPTALSIGRLVSRSVTP